MTIALTIAVVLLIVAVGLCIWQGISNRKLQRDQQLLGDQTKQAELDSQETAANLRAQVAAQQQAQKQAHDSFKVLAEDVLKVSKADFLQLAQKSFEVEQGKAKQELEVRKQAVESLVKPVRQALEAHNLTVQEIEKGRQKADGELQKYLSLLNVGQDTLRDETANLVKALRRPEVRGRWGEIQLRRVAELAGMIEHCDFKEQETLQGGLRPDMIVQLPGECTIVIDAKTPIDAYLDALNVREDENHDKNRSELLQKHVQNIEKQVTALSDKQYQNKLERSPDFVVLFIPGESFLSAAMGVKPTLIDAAMEKGILIASPTTLIALLKMAAMGWQEQQMTENAKRISDLGREMYDRVATAVEHVEKMREHLKKAVESYNDFVGSFESRVVSSARKFKELGAVTPKKLPSDLPQVEITTRQLKPVDMVEPGNKD